MDVAAKTEGIFTNVAEEMSLEMVLAPIKLEE